MAGPLGAVHKYNPMALAERAVVASPVGKALEKLPDPITMIAGKNSRIGRASTQARRGSPGSAADVLLGIRGG